MAAIAMPAIAAMFGDGRFVERCILDQSRIRFRVLRRNGISMSKNNIVVNNWIANASGTTCRPCRCISLVNATHVKHVKQKLATARLVSTLRCLPASIVLLAAGSTTLLANAEGLEHALWSEPSSRSGKLASLMSVHDLPLAITCAIALALPTAFLLHEHNSDKLSPLRAVNPSEAYALLLRNKTKGGILDISRQGAATGDGCSLPNKVRERLVCVAFQIEARDGTLIEDPEFVARVAAKRAFMDKTNAVIVVDRRGKVAMEAARVLRNGGFTDVMYIKGGAEAMQNVEASDDLLADMGANSNVGDARDKVKPAASTAKEDEDWFLVNDASVRSMPLIAGGVGGFLVVLNRVLSGIAPVADASSGQSRADVLSLALSATLLLTGLVWKSVQQKRPVSVRLEGLECTRTNPMLTPAALEELKWTWKLLSNTMSCRSMAVIYGGQCMMQTGMAKETTYGSGEAEVVDAADLVTKPICGNVLKTGKANYFANLALFPGKIEFDFFPPNTQAVIVQPLGEEGLLIIGSDTVRGFRPIDQAWVATVAEKLDSTLQELDLGKNTLTSVPSF